MRSSATKRKRETSNSTGKRMKLSHNSVLRTNSDQSSSRHETSKVLTRSQARLLKGRSSKSSSRGRSASRILQGLEESKASNRSARANRAKSRQKKKAIPEKLKSKSVPVLKDRSLSNNAKKGTNIQWIAGQTIGANKKGQTIKMYGEAYNKDLGLSIKLGSLVKLTGGSTGEIVFLFEREEEKLAELRTVVITGREAKSTEGFLENYLSQIIEVLDSSVYQFIGANGLMSDKQETEESRLYTNRERSKFYKSICDFSIKASLLQAAASLLTLNSVPSCLVGREEEADRLVKFLKNAVKNEGSQSSLCKHYIDMCGMPGTGKTATFLYAMQMLKRDFNVISK